jgi:hypothetical protein
MPLVPELSARAAKIATIHPYFAIWSIALASSLRAGQREATARQPEEYVDGATICMSRYVRNHNKGSFQFADSGE